MEPTLRPFEPADTDGVVAPALRAWARGRPIRAAGRHRPALSPNMASISSAQPDAVWRWPRPAAIPATHLRAGCTGSAGFTCSPLVNYYRLL
jgi:hypothetical protein